jgi:hypothetical protein
LVCAQNVYKDIPPWLSLPVGYMPEGYGVVRARRILFQVPTP